MSLYGSVQLRHFVLSYSETGHSSRGVRFLLRHLLTEWREQNPSVTVQTIHNQFMEPFICFTFADKTFYRTSLKQFNAHQILQLIHLYRNSFNSNIYLKHGGPKVFTTNRSIQGIWTPSLPGQLKALKWFFKKNENAVKLSLPTLPSYSNASLRLSYQCLGGGQSRWEQPQQQQQLFPKGFDQSILQTIFKHPFINDDQLP